MSKLEYNVSYLSIYLYIYVYIYIFLMYICVYNIYVDDQMDTESHQFDESTIAIGCWRGKNSVSVMVTAVDCQELLERLLKDDDAENEDPSAEETKLLSPLSSGGEPNEGVMNMKDDTETKEEIEVMTTPGAAALG